MGIISPAYSTHVADGKIISRPAWGAGLAFLPNLFKFNKKIKADLRLNFYNQSGILQHTSFSSISTRKKNASLYIEDQAKEDGYVEISIDNTSQYPITFNQKKSIKKDPASGFTEIVNSGGETQLKEVVITAPYIKDADYTWYNAEPFGSDAGGGSTGGTNGSNGGGGRPIQIPSVVAKAKYCDIYKKLWEGQASSGVETGAWMTNKGYVPLPTSGINQFTKQYQSNTKYTVNFAYFPTRANGNGYEVYYNGEWLQILGAIHTHPTDGSPGPTSTDQEFTNYWGVPLYGITKSALWSIDKKNGRRDFANYNPAVNCWGAVDPYSYL